MQKDFQKAIAPFQLMIDNDPTQEYISVIDAKGIKYLTLFGDGKIIFGGPVGFNGVPPVGLGAALTAPTVASTGFTTVAPTVADYLIAAPVQNTGFGFSTSDEMTSTLTVLKNALLRIEQIQARLQAAGIIV